jgi:hypothetical protein
MTGVFYSYRLFCSVFFDIKKARKSIYILASRKVLKSINYTNTTKAGTLAIIGLLITSYCVSIYLLNLYLSKDFLYSDFSNFYFSILSMDSF